MKVSKGVPGQVEVALGVPGRLRPQIISTCVLYIYILSRPTYKTVTYTVTHIRCCIDTIDSPDDEHEVARDM